MNYSIFNIVIAITIVLLTYFVYAKLIYPYYLSPLRNLPRHPNAIKHWFKNLYHTLTGRLDINLQLIQAYGPVVHIEDNYVLIQDKDFRKIYLTYKFKKDPIYSLLDVNGPNLFSTTDKGFHVSRRRLISPAFSLKNLQKMEPAIYRVGSDSLVKYIESKLVNNKVKEIDLFQLFHSNTMDVIACLIFGSSLNTTWDREKAQYYNKIIEKTQKTIFFRLIIPFYNFVKLPMETLFKPMILENIRKRRDTDEVHYDILQSLIDSKDPDSGEGLKDLEIVDECLVLLFAGMDTTANTMTWTIYEILKHPDIYKQVTSEIQAHFPDLNEPISVERAKSELKYLEACILESMRKNPVASGAIVRVVPESGISINGHYLPPGTSVGLDIYAQQNDPSIWNSPETFDISRWLGEERELNKSKMFNFGIGPTSCIGRELAWSEIFLVLANLLRTFELEMLDKVLTPNLEFVNRPKEKRFMVSVKRRTIC